MARESGPDGGASRALRLRFESAAEFAEEYRRNVSQGGAFVPCDPIFQLRDTARVVLELAWRGEVIDLDAEVVHVVPAGLAAAGGVAGVALQFHKPAPQLRELLEPYLGEAIRPEEPKPEEAFEDPRAIELDPASEFAFGVGEPAAAQPPDPSPCDPSLAPFEEESAVELPPASRPEGVPRARRKITRVLVRLTAPSGVVTGRTRDIGASGVLVSVDGNDVPVGTRVGLVLTDPFSGERLEVDGVVARQVVAEGTVAALGIHFERHACDREEIARFVTQLWRTDRTRRLGGIQGDLDVGVDTLLQMLGQRSPSGTLTLTRGGEDAVVAFEDRHLRYARLGPLTGVKALSRILGWREGVFEFHAHVDALESEDDPIPLEACLVDAARHLDEAARAGTAALDPSASLSVDATPAGAKDGLDNTELAVLELASAGLTVRRVLDVIPEADARILDAIRSLSGRGLLRVDPPPTSSP